ncbi:MAG TPA: GerMN domain-containing protein [Acidobacteriota bacterium]|nr:GerMN domain-containing protein [Acidobacteriota bacterium]
MSLIESNEYRRILLAVVLVAAATLFAFLVFFLQSRDVQRAEEVPPAAAADPEVLEAADEEDQVELTLYFYVPGTSSPGRLAPLKRNLARLEDPHLMARQIVGEVLRGPDQGLNVFSEQARLRQIYLLSEGTAVVDLSQDTARGLPGGAACEYGALRSLTRSLTDNLEAVDRVKFLVGGQDAPTFAGHVSIRLPFSN